MFFLLRAGLVIGVIFYLSPLRSSMDAPDLGGLVSSALDAVTLACAQANEHYEISKYGTMVAWAKELGRQDVEGILQQILDQEKATDKKLTQIAENMVNQRAQAAA